MFEVNLVKAVEMAKSQRKVANDFTATFPDETIREWEQMVEEWQADSSYPNPYASNERGMFFRRFFTAVSYGYFTSVKTFRGPTAVG